MNAARYQRDLEVVRQMRPEPMTEAEVEAQSNIEAVDFDIFRHKLHMIALEGKETTMRLGASTAMRWGDVAFGIFTAQGDLACCATGIYHHAVLGQIPIKYIIKHWRDDPSVGIREGDSFFYNDPFYAGVHNADMGLAIPVFHDGQLVCFIGAAVHTGECGGSEPGGTVAGARSKYDEGMLIPPIKIGSDFQLKEDLLAMLSAMTRDSRTMILDIKARLAAARVAERRVLDLINDRGSSFFIGALRRILEVTGEAARQKVAALNDGTYRQPRFLDTVGVDNQLVKIDVKLVKRGERLLIDLSNSSPTCQDRPTNSYFQGVIGLAMVYLCGWLFHDLPANNGLLEAVDWRFPDDSLINAKGDVATSMAPMVQVVFTHGIFQCGARMIYSQDPAHAVASWYTGFSIPVFGGLNQHGEPVADITPEINATGCGARYDMDGVDAAGAFFATMADCSDVESTEADRPLLYAFRNYFNQSYGHGKYRGGAGVGLGLVAHKTPFLMLGSHGVGSRFPATLGLFGGYGVPPVFIKTVGGSNLKALMMSGSGDLPTRLPRVLAKRTGEAGQVSYDNVSTSVRPVQDGDSFYTFSGGGAGYGDPLERDPHQVGRDLANGMVTVAAARNIYGVVWDASIGRVDVEASENMRRAMRARRKSAGRPFDEFMREWEQLSPPARILGYYGDYPDPGAAAAQAQPQGA